MDKKLKGLMVYGCVLIIGYIMLSSPAFVIADEDDDYGIPFAKIWEKLNDLQDQIDDIEEGNGFPSEPFENCNLMSEAEQQQVNMWIGNPYQTWKLAYKRSTDGASSTTFHSKVDNRGPSLVVIEFDNGRRSGGYTETSWTTHSLYRGYRKSTDAFLFSLDANAKYPVVGVDYGIYSYSSYGPTFGGGHDLYISSGMTTGYSYLGYSYGWQGQTGSPSLVNAHIELCGSTSSWSIVEIEVFIHT